jgi:hypothetical protein
MYLSAGDIWETVDNCLWANILNLLVDLAANRTCGENVNKFKVGMHIVKTGCSNLEGEVQ